MKDILQKLLNDIRGTEINRASKLVKRIEEVQEIVETSNRTAEIIRKEEKKKFHNFDLDTVSEKGY